MEKIKSKKFLFFLIAVLLVGGLVVLGVAKAQSPAPTSTLVATSTSTPTLTPTPAPLPTPVFKSKPWVPARRGILSIGRNGHTILRDTIVQSVDEENYTMIVKIWGVDLKIDYGDALVIPGVTKNYKCPGKTVRECHLSAEPEASFFKAGDKVNVTGFVEDDTQTPTVIRAKRIYNDLYAKHLPAYILKSRIRKFAKRKTAELGEGNNEGSGNNESNNEEENVNEHKGLGKGKGRKMSREEITNKIQEIMRQIEKIRAKIRSRLVE